MSSYLRTNPDNYDGSEVLSTWQGDHIERRLRMAADIKCILMLDKALSALGCPFLYENTMQYNMQTRRSI